MRQVAQAVGAGLAAIAIGCSVAATAAGQSRPAASLDDRLPPPANTGKPALRLPDALSGEAEAKPCIPALPCGTRLLGEVHRNGAVLLQVPAWRW